MYIYSAITCRMKVRTNLIAKFANFQEPLHKYVHSWNRKVKLKLADHQNLLQVGS